MSNAICPNCKVNMQKVPEPDVTIDKCPRCEGIFLGKNELNILATGMAGDIEYSSIDDDYHKDNYPMRTCPKCINQLMKKINLLQFTDIIFDYCPKCSGFFLDKGELEDMNAELTKIYGSKFSQEYRDYKENHLVRIDILKSVDVVTSFGKTRGEVDTNYLQISVYFASLNVDLKIFDESWLAKLAKIFKIHKGRDIFLGNSEFDNKFIILGNDEKKIKNVFTQDVQLAILVLVSKKVKLISTIGRIKIFDNRIVYLEGPYSGDINVDHDKAFKVVIDDLLGIAKKIESSSQKG